MLKIRKSDERGQTNFNWLDSKHTFSFGHYHDGNHMGFGDLRVINDDIINPGAGFDMHGHRDMEIVTFILDGALEHKDSLGNTAVIKRGEIQRMSAGKGILHSEFNHFKDKKTHLLQIWILPEKKNISPSYEQKPIKKINNGLSLIASKEGSADAVSINQDAKIYWGSFEKGKITEIGPGKDRVQWLHVINGKINLGDNELSAGDAAGIEAEKLQMTAGEDSEFLIFETRK